jgi:hypothetical protein
MLEPIVLYQYYFCQLLSQYGIFSAMLISHVPTTADLLALISDLPGWIFDEGGMVPPHGAASSARFDSTPPAASIPSPKDPSLEQPCIDVPEHEAEIACGKARMGRLSLVPAGLVDPDVIKDTENGKATLQSKPQPTKRGTGSLRPCAALPRPEPGTQPILFSSLNPVLLPSSGWFKLHSQ